MYYAQLLFKKSGDAIGPYTPDYNVTLFLDYKAGGVRACRGMEELYFRVPEPMFPYP